MNTSTANFRARPSQLFGVNRDAMLRKFIENGSVATFIVTAEGELIYANNACGKLLNYDPSRLLGIDFKTLVHKDDLGLARAQVSDLLSGRISSLRSERRYIRSDGQSVWVISSVSVLRSESSEDAFLAVEAVDINAQKAAEAALSESERRWEFALDSAGQGVWDADIENNTVYYSPTWKRIRGYGAEEDIDSRADTWLARVHPDDRERVKEITEKQNAGAVKRNAFEYRELHKAGHYIWILSRGAPDILGADGKPKRVIGTDTDITQRKIAEQETKRLAHRLELALKVSKIGVFEGNLRSGELIWDDRVREIFGIPADRLELRAADWERAVHPDDLPEALAALDLAVSEKRTFSQRYRIVRPDGEIRFVTSQATYFEDADGVPKFIGANEDVTEEASMAEGLKSANFLAEARNVELEAAKARLEAQSLHDALTGLPNRRYLDEVLNRFVGVEGGSKSTGLAVLHIDLDRFKQINDTLGHVAGDAMLKHVAQLLLEAAGIGNFVARVGGDEFVVVCLNETNPEPLAALADLIISKIQSPVPYEGHLCRFGASIGIAIETGRRIDSRRALINSDMALYRAKGRGRNRYEFFSKALQHEAESTKRIGDDILRGIEQREFVPYYQPVVDAKTFAVIGAEALVRWNHLGEGVLAPNKFLKVAEDLDVLAEIDRTILEASIHDLRQWKILGLPIESVSVNVSFRRLNDEGLVRSLRALEIEPGTISFEFLESIFLDEFDDLVACNIDAIRKMGIGIDVDDFGTGHTSFVSLLKLNPRRFKIDRQLIAPISESVEQRRLVASIVDIGRTLGIKVVAEGVETMEQANILRDIGCDYLQGYVFGKPMRSTDLCEWLASPPLEKVSTAAR